MLEHWLFDGVMILQPEDPLEQCIRFLKPLQTFTSDRIETHVSAYEIYSRKGELKRDQIYL